MGRGGGTGGGRRDRRDRSGSEWDMMGLGRARTEIAMSGIIDQRLWERLGRYTRYSTIQWRREVPPNNTGQHSQLLAVCDQRSWCWCQQFVLCGADSAGIWHCKETWTGWVVLWDCGLWHCECSTTYHPRGCGCVSCTHGREDSSKGQTTLSELSVPRQVGRCMRDGGSFSLWCLLVCWLLVVGCWLSFTIHVNRVAEISRFRRYAISIAFSSSFFGGTIAFLSFSPSGPSYTRS